MCGMGCVSCGGSCGMGEVATLNGLGDISDPNVLDMSGTLWTSQPNQYPTIAGQSTDPGAISTGYNWSNVWGQGVTSLFGIASARYGGVQPGQYMQSGSNIAYRLPTGYQASPGANPFGGSIGIGVGTGSMSSLIPILLLGGVGLFAIKALSK